MITSKEGGSIRRAPWTDAVAARLMKITFVTDTYAPQANGVARTLERLVSGLRERGHGVDVIRPKLLGAEEEGLEVKSFPLPGYDGIYVGYSTTAEIQERWERDPPTVIYVATETPLGIAAINAARALAIPVVSGFHTNFQQYLSYYNLKGLQPIATAYLRFVHNRSVRTFVPCEEVREALRDEGFDNLDLLPKGVDTDLFTPERRDEALRESWGVGPKDPVGLYVGRIAPEKNFPLLIRAFERMSELCPGFRGVLVGDGPKRAELEQAHPEIHFAGAKFHEELARHYASADVFVFASKTETFGNVVLEAMASGLVTLAFNYAAAREHLIDGVNGFSAAFDDEEGFLALCDRAMKGDGWEAMRRSARETAMGVSWERVLDDFERCLGELASEPPNYEFSLRSLLHID